MRGKSKPFSINLMPLRGGVRCLVFMLLVCSLSPNLEAKNSRYRKGLQHYTKGEFDKAVTELLKALKQKPSSDERTNIYKFIGISLFTLGRKSEAEHNFKQCINQDSSCAISKSEALDESVLPFFQGIKREMGEKERTQEAKTRILVRTPAKDAEILVDGILLGSANTPLDTKPGTIEITLQAPGYRSQRLNIAVSKNVENVYQVQLDKLPPKAEPKVAAKVEAKVNPKVAKAAALAAAREEAKIRKAELRAAKEAKKEQVPAFLPEENRGGNNSQEESELALRDDRTPLPKKSEAKDSSRNHKERLTKDERETTDKNTDLELPEEKGPPIIANKKQDSAPSKSTASESTKMPISPIHFLPLGVGQFYNQDYILGSLLFGAQSFAVFTILNADQDIVQAGNNERAAYILAETDPTISLESLFALSEAKRKYVAQKQDDINLALGIGAGSWAFGILHAIIMRPNRSPTSAKLLLPPAGEAQSISWQIRPRSNSSYELSLDWEF